MIRLPSFQNLDYRQAVTKIGVGECKLIRSAQYGHEYAHIEIGVEPIDREAGIEFVEQVVEKGAIPERFLSHIEIGCLNAARRGLWGFPLADTRIRILDGSYHDVDSSDAAFEEAAGTAVLQAMLDSAPNILEPLVNLTVRVPEQYVSTILRDLNARRARIERLISEKRVSILFLVPESEVLDYLPMLAALSGGSGILSMISPTLSEVLPDSLTVDRFCATCDCEMKMPLVRGAAFTDNCLVCGEAFRPPGFDSGVGVLSR
jgi:elongation factor G